MLLQNINSHAQTLKRIKIHLLICLKTSRDHQQKDGEKAENLGQYSMRKTPETPGYFPLQKVLNSS